MATAGLAPTLTKKEFKNWLKGALALLFAKDGLTDFVSTVIDRHHQHLLQLVPTANMLNTCTCTINSLPQCSRSKYHGHIVPGPRQLCSRGVCNILMDGICKDHRFRVPSWKNTDPQKWCTDAFEVAKCFYPPDGYSHTTSLLETDFNGIVSVIINNMFFATQIHDNLGTAHNICSKARKVGREIRHTADHLLSDSDLRDYIDDLINLLCDPACLVNDPSAQDAVKKLRMLKTNDLTIHENDLTEALRENIKDTFSDEHRDLLQKINDHYSKLQTDTVAEIDRIVTGRKTELEELAKKLTDDITRHADLMKYEIESYEKRKEEKKFKEKRKELKNELVLFYKKNESMIPVSPLVEDHVVPLADMYVLPPISESETPVAFGQENKPHKKRTVSSYRELLIKNGKDSTPYTNIYVEANAGFGKTSFTQNVAMDWCLPNMENKKSKFEDVDTLQRFDLLFLLHLRDFQGEDTCLLDDMIIKFVARSLPEPERFSEKFIKSMLRTRTCLILCDGLDEWTHPSGKCFGKPGIPHNNYGDNCTVLTTTRPWKISTIGLTPKMIDKHVEISLLDDIASEKLKLNAVKLLSENSGKEKPDLTDFDRKIEAVKLGDICLIPYILLQLICIWFDGLGIGKSKCETYSNTIELTIERGLKKKNASIPPTENAERFVTVPKCMRHNVLCKRHMNLLLKLGKLAFYALFHNIKESSLVIESTFVLKFLTEQELEFCLKIGLLSQSKDSSKVSVKRYKVFFQHKSVQEFMAALYIISERNTETMKLKILNVCSSLSGIVEMANLFIFVSGMNPDVYTCIASQFQKIVEPDLSLSRYKYYQSMQEKCFQESVRNGYESCCIPLHYKRIPITGQLTEDKLTRLLALLQFYKTDENSLVYPSSGITGVQSLTLDHIYLNHNNIELLYAVISQTTPLIELKMTTLSCSNHNYDCDVTLDLRRLNKLTMLHFYNVPCTELRINHTCLEKLVFQPRRMMTARVSATLWQDLRGSPVLSSLTLYRMSPCQEMIQTIPTFTKLKYLELVWIDMNDLLLHFSPQMTKLECVVIDGVTMSPAAWKILLLSAVRIPRSITVKLRSISLKFQEWIEVLLSVDHLPPSVTVQLVCCQGPSKEEWMTIEDVIKSTQTSSLLQITDLWISEGVCGDDCASLTLKKQF